MAGSATQRGSLSVGQLARRWGLGVERVKRLVESGSLPGSFRVPSVGKYGEAIRIPLSTVIQAEQEWAIPEPRHGPTDTLPRGGRRRGHRSLTHFPELNREPGGGYREDDPC